RFQGLGSGGDAQRSTAVARTFIVKVRYTPDGSGRPWSIAIATDGPPRRSLAALGEPCQRQPRPRSKRVLQGEVNAARIGGGGDLAGIDRADRRVRIAERGRIREVERLETEL